MLKSKHVIVNDILCLDHLYWKHTLLTPLIHTQTLQLILSIHSINQFFQQAPNAAMLSEKELQLCKAVPMLPAHYLAAKDAIIRESYRNGKHIPTFPPSAPPYVPPCGLNTGYEIATQLSPFKLSFPLLPYFVVPITHIPLTHTLTTHIPIFHAPQVP